MAHANTSTGGRLSASLAALDEELARRWRPARDGRERAVHRTRVASRRLREVLAVMVAAHPGGAAARAARRVRRITRALGPVRELDVAIAQIDAVARRHRWTPDLTAVIRGRLERERARRARSLHDKLSKSSRQALQDALRDSRARLERDDRDVDAALIGRVERRAGAVLEAVAHVGTLYADEPLHALRIAIKKLRYAAELLPPAALPDLASLLKVLHDAQRRFGALRDRQTLAMHVQAIGEARCGAAMRAALATAAANLEQDCRRLHTRAVAVVPAVDAAAREIRRMVNVPGRRRRFAMARAALTTPAVVRKPAAANS